MGMSDAALPKRGDNYVLIGLPGCGKSTLGRKAAKKLGLKFYDTDELVIKALGTPITFAKLLNGYIHKETQALMKLSKKAKRSVIASGGSVLSFDYNIALLKRLGHILFIDRDPELLLASGKSRNSTATNNGGPLSLTSLNVKSHMDLQYADIADITVENHGDEDSGLANLISAIKSLERDARS
jgi:shikimate kinase